jgi:hypothetical protein
LDDRQEAWLLVSQEGDIIGPQASFPSAGAYF